MVQVLVRTFTLLVLGTFFLVGLFTSFLLFFLTYTFPSFRRYDIATKVPAAQLPLVLGGEMSMWTDSYCYIDQCGSSTGRVPTGHALFDPAQDAAFGKSIGGMIWPAEDAVASTPPAKAGWKPRFLIIGMVMTPVAIGLATALGVDPRPLVVAVMIAASASFATPIGYQTNTLVYGPGGYRFADFLKFGIPLNLSLAPIVSFVIPMIWPL